MKQHRETAKSDAPQGYAEVSLFNRNLVRFLTQDIKQVKTKVPSHLIKSVDQDTFYKNFFLSTNSTYYTQLRKPLEFLLNNPQCCGEKTQVILESLKKNEFIFDQASHYAQLVAFQIDSLRNPEKIQDLPSTYELFIIPNLYPLKEIKEFDDYSNLTIDFIKNNGLITPELVGCERKLAYKIVSALFEDLNFTAQERTNFYEKYKSIKNKAHR